MRQAALESIAGVAEVRWHRGREAAPGAGPDLVLEVPHGATREAHFDALAERLEGPFPSDLRKFFFVNTDVGAPEVAERVAELVVEAEPERTAVVVRCLLPRTFVDCNRLIDPTAAATTSKAGEMTPGIVGYVKAPEDLALLLDLYGRYRALVEAAFHAACAPGGRGGVHPVRARQGEGVMLHSYAPRSVDVPVDERIVQRLEEAYLPQNVDRWPMRSEVDLITTAPDGARLASPRLADAARVAFTAAGFAVAENVAYALHPLTLAHALALVHPHRTLCLELRRDLLMRAFTPFAEMHADPARIDRLARPLARALAS